MTGEVTADREAIWDGRQLSVPVQATTSDVLLGMSMLYGSRLLMDIVDGGQVAISEIP